MGKETTTIDDFTGFEAAPADAIDWFGEKDNADDNPLGNVKPETILEEIDKDDPTDLTPEGKSKKVEEKESKAQKELEDSVFGDFDSPGNSDEDEEEEETDITPGATKDQNKSVVSAGPKSHLEFLKEKGFADFELAEGEELDDVRAEEILEDSWEKSVDSAVEETIKDLPDAVKNLIRVAKEGGDMTAMFNHLAQTARVGLTKDTDMTSEDNQIKAITQDLADQGNDQETIDAQIEFFKSSGKLEAIATKAHGKIIARQTKQESDLAANAKLANDRAKENARVYKKAIAEETAKLSNIKGVVLNAKDKQELPNYLGENNVELDNGRFVTQFQVDFANAMKDKEKSILLAKLLKSDFDFSSISNKTITEYSKGVKTAVQNSKDININASKGSSQTAKSKKPIWEMID